MIETLLLFKILLPTVAAFIIGIALTPMFSHLFYKYRLWKRTSRIDKTNIRENGNDMGDYFEKIHNPEETNTPRIGGVIVWFSVVLTVFLTIIMSELLAGFGLEDIEFISREQTLIPFLSLLLGAGLGLVDDLLQIFGSKTQLLIGIPRRIRIAFVLFMGAVEGLWFYYRLDYQSIDLPFTDVDLVLGFGFVFFVMFVVLALFSSSVIDGVDGLAAGVLANIFAAYGFIGLIQEQFDIATFSFVVMGALLAFLWFNIPPARFYLGETGVLSLTLSLAVIIFLTNTIVEFIIIGLPLVITSASSLGQIVARRFFNKKILKVAPLHHHLELIGWSRAKITMRYWIFSLMCCASGIILVIIA
ncbi:MAG: phospho-N-acetylmuramoyl-pentapeptide-transferase [Candidatus Paceibacteria bacterium]|jgi:phospho-N-acetylmuramoyl-pentapeptide-transferase